MQISQAITRKSASNLALAFCLLPPERRQAMTALYAFCREVDDIADEETSPPSVRHERLAAWRSEIRSACQARDSKLSIPVVHELRPIIQKYGLELKHFEDLLDGVEMDLEVSRYEDYDELELYCYRVASAVGLLSIPIFGCRHPSSRDFACHLGKALQLTNILRDVAVDARRGRIYLPASELRRFQVTPDAILSGAYSERYQALARSVAQKARQFYSLARASLPEEDRGCLRTAELMASVYWRLMRKLEARGFDVFNAGLVRLSKPEKAYLIARFWASTVVRGSAPSYGVS